MSDDSEFETGENVVYRAVLTIAAHSERGDELERILRCHPDTINVERLGGPVMNWLVARDSSLVSGAAEQQIVSDTNDELALLLYADYIAGTNWQDISPAPNIPDRNAREHAWVDKQNRQA